MEWLFFKTDKITLAALFVLALTVIATTLIFVLSALFPTALVAPITYSVLFFLVAGLVAADYKYSLFRKFMALTVDYFAVGVFVVTTLVFLVLGPKLLFNYYGAPGPRSLGEVGYATSVPNAYGDLGWHVATITDLTVHHTFTPPNPIFAGKSLAYPFLANFVSAILISLGTSLPMAVTIPTVIFLPVMCILLYALTKKLTVSSWAGVLAVPLFLLGGGVLGFLRQAPDLSGNSSDPAGFYFLNPIISLLLPERAFVFGFAIAFAILFLLASPKSTTKAGYVLAGILSGLLPLFHVHTTMALVPAIVALFILSRKNWRDWLFFVIPALVLGLPEVFYYVFAMAGQPTAISWHVGWMFDKAGLLGWVWGWLRNTGLFLPVAILGIFLKTSPSSLPDKGGAGWVSPLKALALAGFFLFIFGNLVLVAPWVWDNIKLLIFWYLFCLPLVAMVIVWTWQKYDALVRTGLVILVVGHLIAGSADVLRIASPAMAQYPIWSAASVQFAAAVQKVIPPDAVLLTGSVFNSPGALTGRSLYLGYPAHVWTHGGNPWPREAAAKALYKGRGTTLPEMQPDYAITGPEETGLYGTVYTQPNWKLIVASGPYSLYQIN